MIFGKHSRMHMGNTKTYNVAQVDQAIDTSELYVPPALRGNQVSGNIHKANVKANISENLNEGYIYIHASNSQG